MANDILSLASMTTQFFKLCVECILDFVSHWTRVLTFDKTKFIPIETGWKSMD